VPRRRSSPAAPARASCAAAQPALFSPPAFRHRPAESLAVMERRCAVQLRAQHAMAPSLQPRRCVCLQSPSYPSAEAGGCARCRATPPGGRRWAAAPSITCARARRREGDAIAEQPLRVYTELIYGHYADKPAGGTGNYLRKCMPYPFAGEVAARAPGAEFRLRVDGFRKTAAFRPGAGPPTLAAQPACRRCPGCAAEPVTSALRTSPLCMRLPGECLALSSAALASEGRGQVLSRTVREAG